MKKKKSKRRQNKSYNKKSKFRRKKSKKKMIGGSIYDTQSVFEDRSLELSRENERLRTKLEEFKKRFRICMGENKILKTKLAQVGHSSAAFDFLDGLDSRTYNEWGQPISTLPDFPRFHPPPKGTIELGFTKDEVLRVLGNPTTNYATDFQGEIWSYRDTNDLSAKNYQEYYNIRFDMSAPGLGPGKGVVTLYRDIHGRKLGDETKRGPRAAVMVKKLRAQRESVQRETAQTTTPSVPHAETTLEYHQSELGRMGGTSPPSISPPSTDFSEGDRVYYNNRGEEQLATILGIDRNVPLGEDPYVTLKIDGQEGERQTNMDRIRKVDEEFLNSL